jgi:hypothetical protein
MDLHEINRINKLSPRKRDIQSINFVSQHQDVVYYGFSHSGIRIEKGINLIAPKMVLCNNLPDK